MRVDASLFTFNCLRLSAVLDFHKQLNKKVYDCL